MLCISAVIKFMNQMCAVLQTVQECFAFVGTAQTATEVEYGVVIVQGQNTQELFQFLKAVADLRRVRLVGLCVGLV